MKSIRELFENHADILAVAVLIVLAVIRSGGLASVPAVSAAQDCGDELGFRSPICPDFSPFAMGQVDHAQREVRRAEMAIRQLRFNVQ